MNDVKSAIVRRIGAESRHAQWAKRLVAAAVIAGSLLIGLMQVQAPRPAAGDAPPESFSAERAMEKLNIIALEPHPAGTPAQERVRDYLVAELESLGLQTQLQVYETAGYNGISLNIENIAARIPGTGNGKALMLAAHYDSAPGAPGAADDGAAIAAMLETARALSLSPPLANDLILLMTDGEELGLLGAEAFMYEHPWAQDIGLVLNFEARGNKGPSFMFETSEGNGLLISEFLQASPYPAANSFLSGLYELMPNDTDLTVFREGGLPGLNFAFGMGLDAYHTERDTPENLDPASLQHHGEYMLSLSRHFGSFDLSDLRAEDRVYFNVFGWQTVHYPVAWAIPLMLGGAALTAVTLWHGKRRGLIGFAGVVKGLFVALTALAGAVFLSAVLRVALSAVLSPEHYTTVLINPGASIAVWLILSVLTGLPLMILLRRLMRGIAIEEIWFGVMIVWLLLSAVSALYLPGGSYLTVWPLLSGLLALNAAIRMKSEHFSWLAALGAAPCFILLAPNIYLASIMLTLHLAPAVIGLVALAGTLLMPLLSGRAQIFGFIRW